MRYDDVAIPHSGAWTSPFVKWQGSLGELSSLDVAATVTTRAPSEREIDPADLAGIVLGWPAGDTGDAGSWGRRRPRRP